MSDSNEYISFDMNQEWFKINGSVTLCNPNNQDDKLVFSSVEELLDFNRKIWDLKKQYEWQPIETAPKDGTWILVYRNFLSYGFDADEWDADKWVARWAYDAWYETSQYTIQDPTHWMPLPNPPETIKKN